MAGYSLATSLSFEDNWDDYLEFDQLPRENFRLRNNCALLLYDPVWLLDCCTCVSRADGSRLGKKRPRPRVSNHFWYIFLISWPSPKKTNIVKLTAS